MITISPSQMYIAPNVCRFHSSWRLIPSQPKYIELYGPIGNRLIAIAKIGAEISAMDRNGQEPIMGRLCGLSQSLVGCLGLLSYPYKAVDLHQSVCKGYICICKGYLQMLNLSVCYACVDHLGKLCWNI